MAILFTDGFDSYGTTTGTNLLTRWTSSSNPNGVITSTTPYSYGQAHSPGNSAGNASTVAFNATSTVTIGANVYILGGATTIGWYPIFGLLSSGTWMMGLTVAPDGGIAVSRMTTAVGPTILVASGTNAGTIRFNNWYYIEFSVTISDTVGTVRVDVDGRTVINQTGLDTRNGTPTTVNTLSLGRNNDAGAYFDDLYITDTISPLGPQRIYTLRPNADTVEKDWVPLSGSDNYAMVDETAIDGDTTYVSASTVGDFDLYDVGDYPVATATIKAVNHVVWARKTDATARTITSTTKSGATTTDSSAFTLGTTYTGFSKIYEADPNTSTTWTVSGVNALQIGQKVAS